MAYYTIRDPRGEVVCGSPDPARCETRRQIEIEDALYSIDYERQCLPRSLEWCSSHRQRAGWIAFHRSRLARAKRHLKHWQAAQVEVAA